MSLIIDHLHVAVGGTPVLRGLNLHIPSGELHAVMGPNGAGKSTLTAVLAGHEDYEITAGSIRYRDVDLTALPPEERAAAGLFTAVQYPPEIPGVAGMVFMRTALNALRRKRGEEEMTAPAFLRAVKAAAATVGLPDEMLKRAFNDGFSGGEKKRAEIIQMLLAQPSLCVLDEIDSGLDVDAMKRIAAAVSGMRDAERAFLVITHYRRLLDHLVPDRVHVLAEGRIVHSGGSELIERIEQTGYASLV